VPAFWNPGSSLPCSQDPAFHYKPEPHQSSQHPLTFSILILTSHLHLGFTSSVLIKFKECTHYGAHNYAVFSCLLSLLISEVQMFSVLKHSVILKVTPFGMLHSVLWDKSTTFRRCWLPSSSGPCCRHSRCRENEKCHTVILLTWEIKFHSYRKQRENGIFSTLMLIFL
jgi:hypothetical protein